MKKILATTVLTLLLLCQNGYGLELQAAKEKGLVGETSTGYLGAVGTPDQAVTDLLNTINGKRKAQYQGIAKKNKTSLEAVEQLAGKTAIGKTPAGQFIDTGTGWKKK